MKPENELLGKKNLIGEFERLEIRQHTENLRVVKEEGEKKRREITRVGTDVAKQHGELYDIEYLKLQNWKKRSEKKLMDLYKKKELEYRKARKKRYDEIESMMTDGIMEIDRLVETQTNAFDDLYKKKLAIIELVKESLENGEDVKISKNSDGTISLEVPQKAQTSPSLEASLSPT